MKTIRHLFFITLILLFVWACTHIGSNDLEAFADEVETEKWSELAILMREMHNDAKAWRDSLNKGKDLNLDLDLYEKLITSTPTDSTVTGPVFEGFAKNYQARLDSFLLVENRELTKLKYNDLVTACITCHQEYCPGPVKTIKKLYFPID